METNNTTKLTLAQQWEAMKAAKVATIADRDGLTGFTTAGF
jgi:hypothetical protein